MNTVRVRRHLNVGHYASYGDFRGVLEAIEIAPFRTTAYVALAVAYFAYRGHLPGSLPAYRSRALHRVIVAGGPSAGSITSRVWASM